MPFEKALKDSILSYCTHDLPDDDWYKSAFSFIKDEKLKNRLIAEFKNVRFIYKVFEGLSAKDELLLAEVRMQILMYASIYEAVIHYVLFDEYYQNTQEVKDLLIHKVTKRIDIPQNKRAMLSKCLCHDGKDIITSYETAEKRDVTKIRFDEKCRAAFQLGILAEIPEQLDPNADLLPDIRKENGMPIFYSELVRIYEVRNAIHLQAELKKEIAYQLQLSKIAYKRMAPFLGQIKAKLAQDKLI